ncbi:MAG: ribonuclease H-like domain-containing protein [Eubacteriales bacterium]|nr:ribonuclease H-like domain-containing protein [Eubacteriales bacterium]
MKKFSRKYRFTSKLSDAYRLYYGSLTPCVFDIETTGLGGGRNTSRVILTAMLIPTEEGIEVTQFLAEQPFEEDRVLQATLDYFDEKNIDFLITYNGTSFDIPFTNKRLDALHLPYQIQMHNLDLYSWIKRNTTLPGQLSSLSQKSVEHYFHMSDDRIDVISGKESVKLYYEYATTHSGMLEKVILTHNREDVVQLYRILQRIFSEESASLLRKQNVHEAMATYGFPLSPKAALTLKPKISGKNLLIRGAQHCTIGEMMDFQRKSQESTDIKSNSGLRVYYDDTERPFPMNAAIFPDASSPLQADFRAKTSDFQISFPLESYGNSLYADLTLLSFTGEEKARLKELKGYVNDYLILQEEGNISFLEMNALSRVISSNITKRIRTF